jgi:hypothetical protein
MRGSSRALGRRQQAVVVVALLLFGVFALWRTQQPSSAHAITTPVTYTCGSATTTAYFTAVIEPEENIVPGGDVNIAEQVMFSGLTGPANISGVEMLLPMPTQVAINGTDSGFAGAGMKGTIMVMGSDVHVAYTGTATPASLNLAKVDLYGKAKAGATGTLRLMSPSSITIHDTITMAGMDMPVTCTAAPVQIQSGTMAPPVTTTTTTTTRPTTSTSTTTTTRPTTSTSTTTTTRPTTSTSTTTTTRPTTSTSTTTTTRPTTSTSTTTTTRPTTSTSTTTATGPTSTTTTTRPRPPGNGFGAILRRIICILFRICPP